MQVARSLAVLGSPIGHSLSPILHTAAYRVLGLDWSYGRREVAGGELAGFLGSLGPEWRGLSLTMPLKREVLPLLDSADEVAASVGAANTILLQGTARHGFNTDVHGLVGALRDAGVSQAGRVDLIGGGATAASVVAAAAELGSRELRITTRTPAKSHGLIELGERLGLRVLLGSWEPLTPGADVVVATLPAGTRVDGELVAAAAPGSVLFDVAYDPWPSPLAESWTRSGGTAVSGIGMLVHQALRQVRIFVGGAPSVLLPQEERVLGAMADAVGYSPAASHS